MPLDYFLICLIVAIVVIEYYLVFLIVDINLTNLTKFKREEQISTTTIKKTALWLRGIDAQ